MKIEHLRVNHMEKPMGYHFPYLTFSWKVREAQAAFSSTTRLLVSEKENMEDPIFDSGMLEAFPFCQMQVERKLRPRTRYYWKVSVSTDLGEEAESEVSWFETGKMEEGWSGEWIAASEDGIPGRDPERMPVLYKDFSLDAKVRKARLYILGTGLYEVGLNGKKAGEEYLMPGYHSYDCFMEYQTLDVTGSLKKGQNRIEILLGEGWYKGRFGFDDHEDTYHDLYGSRKKAIAELYAEYEDGRTEWIRTDDTWKAYASTVKENSIYDGESVDDTCEDTPLFVEVLNEDKSILTERTSQPLHITERIKPVQIIKREDHFLLDFGQIITGWVEFSGDFKKGQKIRLQYGEVLQDGEFYRENLRTAKAEFQYVSDGTKKNIRPHFTYFGFRYVKVEGMEKAEDAEFTACRLMSDIEQTGYIETSNDKVNQLFHNTRNSQKCNFLDIPTDCPQRDERMGWTGDVTVFAPTACFHMDCAAFFDHYARCVYAEQQLLKGAVPFFAPRPKVEKTQKANPFYFDGGACIWSDVATLMPWTLYTYYGDKGLLKQHYPMMRSWVEYMRERSSHNEVPYLWQQDRHLGDWLALDNGNIHNPIGRTDMGFIASLFYCWSVSVLAKASNTLLLPEAKEYEELGEHIKEAFTQYYFTEDGRLTIEETQTACALLLYLGLYPPHAEEYLKETLKRLILENDGHLNTGFAGTFVLCPALSESGMNELAYDLLLQEGYPSWLNEVNLGATTVWERWNSLDEKGKISGTGMNSLNHYAYGSIADWMYRYMCGFRPQMDKEISMVIAPKPDQRFKYVKGIWESPYGTYECQWCCNDAGRVSYDVEVPFNARVRMIFPSGKEQILSQGCYHFEE